MTTWIVFILAELPAVWAGIYYDFIYIILFFYDVLVLISIFCRVHYSAGTGFCLLYTYISKFRPHFPYKNTYYVYL